MGGKYEWLFYVGLAGLAWGTYVPLIAFGGGELGGKGARIMAILCVGIAYFLIAVLFPLFLFLTKQYEWPEMTTNGLVFSGLAGAAGAVGALCVVFANRAALGIPNAKLYIAPLIFGLAPVINTLVSVFWHPQKGQPFHFAIEVPGWKLWVGILLVGLGAALVLFSKEEAETHQPKPPSGVPVAHAPAETGIQQAPH
jgi:drug/metabolite transporter (DMT)-like permease